MVLQSPYLNNTIFNKFKQLGRLNKCSFLNPFFENEF